jgi:WD40 repeat protein
MARTKWRLGLVLALAVLTSDARSQEKGDPDDEPLPPGARMRLGAMPWRGVGYIPAIAISPDGRTLVTAEQRRICHWDMATGRKVRVAEFEKHDKHGFVGITLSADGKLAAGTEFIPGPKGETYGDLFLWNAATGKIVQRFAAKGNHPAFLAFSPDGKHLVWSAGWTVHLWDVVAAKEVHRLEGAGHGKTTWGIAFSPDGKLLAAGRHKSATSSGTIQLWNVASGRLMREVLMPVDLGRGLIFAPDGNSIAVNCLEFVVRLDATTGKELARYAYKSPNRLTYVSCLAFAPDGKTLVVGGEMGAYSYDAATGERRQWPASDANTNGRVCALAYSADGKSLAVSIYESGNPDERTFVVLDPVKGVELPAFSKGVGHINTVHQLAFTPDGRTLVSAGLDYTICHWDPTGGKLRRRFLAEYAASISLASDGLSAAWPVPKGVHVRDLGAGKNANTIAVDFRDKRGHPFPGGELVAVHSWLPQHKRRVYLFDRASGKELRQLAHEWDISWVSIAPDGKTLAATGRIPNPDQLKDNPALKPLTTIWDVATGRKRFSVDESYRIAFSPDGRLLAGASPWLGRVEIRVWQADGKELSRIKIGPNDLVDTIAFSPDGRTLAAALHGKGITIGLREVATGIERKRLKGHCGLVQAIAFSPDGKTLASAGRDIAILLWDVGPSPKAGSQKAVQLTGKELEALWADLADENPKKGWQAVWILAGAPEQAPAFLKQRLQPVSMVEGDHLQRWIKDLESDQFSVRQKATQELEKLGRTAEAALRKVPIDKLSLEGQQRVKQLLARLAKRAPSSWELQQMRGAAALEYIGSADARSILERLAKGREDAPLTQDALATLDRLAKRK